jgi:hypothetical protein
MSRNDKLAARGLDMPRAHDRRELAAPFGFYAQSAPSSKESSVA